jgi:hypothetical protein
MEAGCDSAAGRPADLIRRHWPQDEVRLAAEDPSSLQVARDLPGVRALRPAPDGTGAVDVELDDLRRVPELVLALTTRGVRLTEVAPHDRSLEELYFAVRAPHVGATPLLGRGEHVLAPGVDVHLTGSARTETEEAPVP